MEEKEKTRIRQTSKRRCDMQKAAITSAPSPSLVVKSSKLALQAHLSGISIRDIGVGVTRRQMTTKRGTTQVLTSTQIMHGYHGNAFEIQSPSNPNTHT
jgi:hypothetical protein